MFVILGNWVHKSVYSVYVLVILTSCICHSKLLFYVCYMCNVQIQDVVS